MAVGGSVFKFNLNFLLQWNFRYEVQFHEENWFNVDNPGKSVTREMMMVGLQNIQELYIR